MQSLERMSWFPLDLVLCLWIINKYNRKIVLRIIHVLLSTLIAQILSFALLFISSDSIDANSTAPLPPFLSGFTILISVSKLNCKNPGSASSKCVKINGTRIVKYTSLLGYNRLNLRKSCCKVSADGWSTTAFGRLSNRHVRRDEAGWGRSIHLIPL